MVFDVCLNIGRLSTLLRNNTLSFLLDSKVSSAERHLLIVQLGGGRFSAIDDMLVKKPG